MMTVEKFLLKFNYRKINKPKVLVVTNSVVTKDVPEFCRCWNTRKSYKRKQTFNNFVKL